MALTGLTGIQISNLNVSGIATFEQTVGIAGTLTYEDVTNVDSVGLVTARDGIKVSGGQVLVGSGTSLHSTGLDLGTGNITGHNLKSTGIITSTTFSGSGASLTNLPAANLTGTLPAISGANLTNLDASDLASGTVPTARLGSGTASSSTFLAGDSTYKTITGTTINNNADNRVITGSGSANTLEGESTFTHNPSTFDTIISHNGNTPADLIIENTHNSFTGAVARLHISSGDNSNVGGMLELECNGQYHGFESRKNGNLYISDNGTAKLTLDSSGNLNIADGNLAINTAGHGIDFSATSGSGTSELLDDYEEGSWQPTWSPASGSIGHQSRHGDYIKVGKVVHCMFAISANGSTNPSGELKVSGLPFTATIPNAQGLRGGGGVAFAGYHMNTSVTKCMAQGSNVHIILSDNSRLQSNSSGIGYGYNAAQLSGMFSYITS